MTAAEIADKLREAGGDTASLSPVEQELLMRALRTWDELLAALNTVLLSLGDLEHGDPNYDAGYVESVTRDAIARAEAAPSTEPKIVKRIEASTLEDGLEPKIVKRIEAAILEDGLARRLYNCDTGVVFNDFNTLDIEPHYWTEIVGAYTSWVIRPDGSLAGVVTQVRKGD